MSLIVGNTGAVMSPAMNHPLKNGDRGFEQVDPLTTLFGKLKNAGKNVDPDVARQIYSQIDFRNRGHVTKQELIAWITSSAIFPKLEADDAMLTANRLFHDIDRDQSGTLEFGEFVLFLENTQREQKLLKYADKHHLTSLPSSFRTTNSKQFKLPFIEAMLEKKIDQLTSKDGDRMRQILTMMKTQMQRTSGQTDSSNIVMYQRDFCIFLSMLGLFATRAQSDLLFAKYDVNGDGCLSLYEFLTKAKAPDYPGFDDGGEVYNERKGKRQFDDTGGKPPPRVQTPETSLFDQSRDQLHERIRERIEQKARTGVANSDNFARRKLFAAFERFDKEKCGLISLKSFSDTLEKDIGVVMGSAHVRALCKKFATDGLVDYPRLVAEIYPPTNGLQNSSVVQPRKNAGELSARKQVMPPGQNTVNVTGSYWATGTPKSLPPAPDPLSYTLEGTLSRPMSGLGSPSARVPKSSASLVSRTKASPAPTTKAAPMLRKVPVTKKVPASATFAATLSPAKASTISKVGSKAISRIGSRTMTPVH